MDTCEEELVDAASSFYVLCYSGIYEGLGGFQTLEDVVELVAFIDDRRVEPAEFDIAVGDFFASACDLADLSHEFPGGSVCPRLLHDTVPGISEDVELIEERVVGNFFPVKCVAGRVKSDGKAIVLGDSYADGF